MLIWSKSDFKISFKITFEKFPRPPKIWQLEIPSWKISFPSSQKSNRPNLQWMLSKLSALLSSNQMTHLHLGVLTPTQVRVSLRCKQRVTCCLKPTKRSCSQPRPLPPCFLHWLGMFITLGRGQGGSQVREGALGHTAGLWHCPETDHNHENFLSGI